MFPRWTIGDTIGCIILSVVMFVGVFLFGFFIRGC